MDSEQLKSKYSEMEAEAKGLLSGTGLTQEQLLAAMTPQEIQLVAAFPAGTLDKVLTSLGVPKSNSNTRE